MKKFCSECGTKGTGGRFCANCGALMEEAGDNMKNNGSITANPQMAVKPAEDIKPVDISPDDSKLKQLISCCRSGAATGAGSSRYEVILYIDETDNTYQVHTYSSEGGNPEVHKGYYLPEEKAKNLLNMVAGEDLSKYSDVNVAASLGGGSRVIKIRKENGESIRLEAALSFGEGLNFYDNLNSAIRKSISEEDRILPHKAIYWKEISLTATGMAQNSNYAYKIRRNEKGKLVASDISLKAAPAIGGMAMMNANTASEVELSSEIQARIEAMKPGGLDDYNKPHSTGMANMQGNRMATGMGSMMGMGMATGTMRDASSNHMYVTYSSGEKVEKIWNSGLMSEIAEMLRPLLDK